MVLSFKPQFEEKILAGTKIHTIREDKNDRWEKGNKIHFATGVRTKNYNCFKQGRCNGVQDIFMTYAWNDIIQISVDGYELFGYQERLELAKNDGFDTWEDFFQWFYPLIQSSKDKSFSGKLIHWTAKRYKYESKI